MAFFKTGSEVAEARAGMRRVTKRAIVMAVDAALCAVAVYLALYLRLGEIPPVEGPWWSLIGASIVLALPIFTAFGLYRTVFRQAGMAAVSIIARACAVYGIVYAALFTFGGFAGIPRTAGIIQPILLLLLVSASRVFARFWLGGRLDTMLSRTVVPRVLIYGAGSTGRQLRAALEHSAELTVVGYLDDARDLQRATIDGMAIHDPADIERLVVRLRVSEVLLALPSIGQRRRAEIIAGMKDAQVHVRTLPSISDMAHGRVAVADLRELDIADLLGRDAVAPDPSLLARNIHDKVVLVTGAGGSIGSELCRQILAIGPRTLLLVDHSEFSLYAIHRELSARVAPPMGAPPVEIVPLLGSVIAKARMVEIMASWRPDTVYHAAAYKHVPLVEHNPIEGVRNNVVGTLTAALAAIETGVPTFVLISTDKAVRPTNVMGTTKRIAELVLQSLNAHQSGTTFAMVRFGNVLGSSGSVVPLFRQQIREGGPVTVTDLRITRYFMTIPEAAQLVIQAGAMGTGGEVFVLDMGEPVLVANLARTMIELSGRTVRNEENPDGDIAITEVGLRPGEKLYEELLIGGDPSRTPHPRILMAHEDFLTWPVLSERMAALQAALADLDVARTIALIRELVPEFEPEQQVTPDWISLRRLATEAALPVSDA